MAAGWIVPAVALGCRRDCIKSLPAFELAGEGEDT
jgi:hypothetical protein